MKQYTESNFPETVDLDVFRFATFITDVVAKRKLPTFAGVHNPRIVIKADIEGAELKVFLFFSQTKLYLPYFQIIPDMVVSGALNHMDNIHMEWHDVSTYRQGREPEMISKLVRRNEAITTLGSRYLQRQH